MRISDLLRGRQRKSGSDRSDHRSDVVTVTPEQSIRELLAVLGQHNIGAAVVSPDGRTIAGIVSERDVVRALDRHGAELLASPVSEIMTRQVRTCSPTDSVADLREVMTEGRFRHVPVVLDGRLVSIVSIGDVVKSTIDQLETEREHLVGYIQS